MPEIEVTDLNPMVVFVSDDDPSRRVHGNTCRSIELTRLGARGPETRVKCSVGIEDLNGDNDDTY